MPCVVKKLRHDAMQSSASCYQLDPPPPGYDSWAAWLTEHGIPQSEWISGSAIVDPAKAGPRIYFQRGSRSEEPGLEVLSVAETDSPPPPTDRARGQRCSTCATTALRCRRTSLRRRSVRPPRSKSPSGRGEARL